MPKRINLLAKGERVRTATNVPALALMAGALIVVFALGLSYYLLTSERGSLQDELAQLKNTREAKEALVRELDQYKQLATDKAEMEKTVQGVYAGRTLVSQVLGDLSRVLPENVWLTSLTISAGDPQVQSETEGAGFVSGSGTLSMQGNTYSFPDVALLLVRLKLVPALQDITLASAGQPIGSVDPKKNVRGFSLGAAVINTQTAETPLPMSKVEVEGL